MSSASINTSVLQSVEVQEITTEAVEVSEAPAINPFLFLQPYGLNDHFRFLGREDEARSLLALLKWKDIIVVYGKSGVGKTSFINNTLSSRINRVNWLPVRITRLIDINHSLKQGIQFALEEESLDNIHNKDLGTDTLPVNEDPITGQTAVQLMKALYIKWNRPIYLIIDQLEELFLVGDKNEQDTFLETLHTLINASGIQKKIILVLREEHLKYIQEIERRLYGVFQDALCVKDIKMNDASDIFHNLLTTTDPVLEQELTAFAQKISPDTIKNRIIISCSKGEAFNVQKLQILLFVLWEKIHDGSKNEAEGALSLEVERLCDSPDPLGDYLDITVNNGLADDARLLKAPYWFILRNAISNANTKKPVSLRDFDKLIWESLGYPEKGDVLVKRQKDLQLNIETIRGWCDKLVDKRILQSFSIARDGKTEFYYQLRHDTLVEPIKSLYTGLSLRFPKKVSRHKLDQNPYMGLWQYEYDGASKGVTTPGLGRKNIPVLPVLYGRENVINEYVEFLKKPDNKYLVVVGDSGTGKSSLVKGGLLPAMQQAGFSTSTLQPGPDQKAFTDELLLLFNKHKTGLNANANRKHCLYIDQFEECYTFRKANFEEKDRFRLFLRFLTNEIDQRGGNFKLIVSIRHDYAHEFDRNAGEEWRTYKKLLRYPNQEEIFDIIVGPAYERGIKFKPEKLPEIIATDAMNTSYFLPLLSFTMQTMYRKEVIEHPGKYQGIELCLTLDGYEQAGKIVECLQDEFTSVFGDLSGKDQQLFLEIMARMIIIKDTIPKARPLPIASLNYVEPCKADQVQQILVKFIPSFFREKDIIIDNCVTRCYEPLHDSLLIYCDEIRQIVNKVQEPGSQMYLQPRIEAAVKEWKGNDSPTNEMQTGNVNEQQDAKNKLLQIIDKRHRELEPLFDLVMSDGKPAPDNWLFKEEFELIKAGKEHAGELRNQEKILMDQKMNQLKLEINQQKLLQEKIKAEQDLALAEEQKKKHELELERNQQLLLQEKLKAEHELALAEKEKKEQELALAEKEKKENELLAQTYLTKGISERRKKWLFLLWALVLTLIGIGYAWNYIKSSDDRKKALLIKQQEDKINESRKDSIAQARNNAILEKEKRKTDSLNAMLALKIEENNVLLARLMGNKKALEKANKQLEQRRAYLAKDVGKKDSIINDIKNTKDKYEKAYNDLKTNQMKVDTSKQ